MMQSDSDASATIEASVRWLAALGALFALTGVAAGAFGAHALRSWLPPERAGAFETAVRYQALHALALFATAWVVQTWRRRIAVAAGACFVVGTVLFCGSLYALALLGEPQLGIVTPLGGMGLLIGWALLAVAIVKSKG
ncbi:MAG TPA: DUF423 domain-containing protein [Burkholderiaceae bacterium]|jgi:uncharacterized membrane protein YgdD (TMEM256/DUF423 family)|nr:DUF423 domain-containing protein [Burkholderiaceae bacterium]